MADTTDPGLKSKVVKSEDQQQSVKVQEGDVQSSPSSSMQSDKVIIEDNQTAKKLPDSLLCDPSTVMPSMITGDDDKTSEKGMPNEEYSAAASSGGDGMTVVLTLPKEENAVEIIPLEEGVNNVDVLPANEENVEPSLSKESIVEVLPANDENVDPLLSKENNVEVLPANEEGIEPSLSKESNVEVLPVNEKNVEQLSSKESNVEVLPANEENVEPSSSNESNVEVLPANEKDMEPSSSKESNIQVLSGYKEDVEPLLSKESNVEVLPAYKEDMEPSSSEGDVLMVMTMQDYDKTNEEPGCVDATSSDESMGLLHISSSDENLLSHSDEERIMNDIQDLAVEATDSLTLLSVSDTDCRPESGYVLKRIMWQKRIVPIVTQNENGPCPLIAIANVLLLRGKIVIPSLVKVVTAEQLMEYVADCIIENIPKNLSGLSQLNYEQNMHDAIGVLPQLLTGLDVNVRFTGVRDFEYTPECIIFDLLNIPLYHGWLVDPQAKEIMEAIGNLGYNQLVEKIIMNKFSDDSDAIAQALTAEIFLENSATQLTYHGLCELNSAMVSNELAILFRNNHFSTIYKKGVDAADGQKNAEAAASVSRENELFQLVTDQGFLNEQRVVWEALCNIEGDSQFVDGNFVDSPTKTADVGPGPDSFPPLGQAVSTEQQINQDFLVALSLQEDQTSDQKTNEAWEGFEDVGSNSEMSSIDLELARRLQQNYHRDVRAVPSRPPSSSQLRSPDRNKKGSSCTIL